MSETLTGKLPIFGGSTGGLLTKARVEEKYAITWISKKEQVFEMPTGGAAIMHEGDNLMYFARKEQCLALGTQLRTKFKPKIEKFKIYRIFPSGEIEFLHPKDGKFPEKVNKGRVAVNTNPRRIGQNQEPSTIKFTGRKSYD
ncbi:MAG: photosystem I reaction center subunit II PsaD [Cyanobacteria bacterium P01_F01_bin.150]